MDSLFPVRLDILAQVDIIFCRQKVREIAVAWGFGLADQTRLATAVSELTRNALEHGGGGSCQIVPCQKNGRDGIRVVIEDNGPGIADIAQALQDGYSTHRGMGLGLPAAKRLVHGMDIESRPGRTVLLIEMFLNN
ncbi:MAG: anti-sigma regulatory factor [Mariprofundaceae bacterium]